MMTDIGRWDRSVQLLREQLGSDFGGPKLPYEVFIVRFRRSTRLFLAGDLAIALVNNGQAERYPVTGRSSRGYEVVRFYTQIRRYLYIPRFNRQYMRDRKRPRWQVDKEIESGENSFAFENKDTAAIIELPGELAGKTPADPDVRRYVAERLCVAASARPVDAGSGVSSSDRGEG